MVATFWSVVCRIDPQEKRQPDVRIFKLTVASGQRFFEDQGGKTHYLRRTVDREGEVLEGCYVSMRRDHKAALKFTSKSMKRNGQSRTILMEKLRSYRVGIMINGNIDRQETGRWLNYRAENFHLTFTRLN